jgi:hypothetical protein
LPPLFAIESVSLFKLTDARKHTTKDRLFILSTDGSLLPMAHHDDTQRQPRLSNFPVALIGNAFVVVNPALDSAHHDALSDALLLLRMPTPIHGP